MDDVRRCLLGPPHGTTAAAVIANKINKNESFGSSKIFRGYNAQFGVMNPHQDLNPLGYESFQRIETLYLFAITASWCCAVWRT